MANLVTNGGFDGDTTGWTLPTGGGVVPTWDSFGHNAPGSLLFQPVGGLESVARQDLTVPSAGTHQVTFWLYWSTTTGMFRVDLGDAKWIYINSGDYKAEQWHQFTLEMACSEDTQRLQFDVWSPQVVYLDDVSVRYRTWPRCTLNWLVDRMRSERQDLAGVLYSPATYERIVEEAAGSAPVELWPRVEDDTTIETVAGQVDYDLSGITDLARAEHLVGVWIRPAATGDTQYQDWEPVAFRVYDNAGALTLRFTRPWTARQVRLVYATAPATPTEDTAADIDCRWLVAECMIRLWRRPVPGVSAAERQAWVEYWTRERVQAYQDAQHHDPPRVAHTPYWPLR